MINNQAALLFSVDTSPHIYVEDITSVIAPGPWAIGAPPFPPGNDIDQHGVFDLDGLEVWGEDGPFGDDANRYSLEFDSVVDPTVGVLGQRVAVFAYAPGPGISAPLFYVNQLAGAISGLMGLNASQFSFLNTALDLDAMMTFGPADNLVGNFLVATAGNIMWSIDPLTLPGNVTFTGDEIFVWNALVGGAASFLSHDGHLWDTAFDVAAAYGVETQNVNALEAVAIPEPSTAVLLGFGSLGLLGVSRRLQARSKPRA